MRELASDLQVIRLTNELRAFDADDLGMPWPRVGAELVWRYGVRNRVPVSWRRLLRRKRTAAESATSILGPELVSATKRAGSRPVRPGDHLVSARAEHLDGMTSPVVSGATETTYRIARSIGIDFRK